MKASPARSSRQIPLDFYSAPARPFVKWAGGKGTLVGEISKRLPPPKTFTRYVEPFVGAGALFFRVREHWRHLPCRIADNNSPLITAYLALRDRVDEVIAALRLHERKHSKEYYYAVRKLLPQDAAEQAALFIYLNRTCYNGLWRVNRRGEFNVPFGRYRNPRILDQENLRRVSAALSRVEILCCDFEQAVADCERGSFVYLDPPYHPLSPTSNFTAYTAGGFGSDQQLRLARVFELLAKRGAFVILSNSDTLFIRKLYRALRPRPNLDPVWVPRAINSKGEARQRIKELLIYSRKVAQPGGYLNNPPEGRKKV